MSSPLRILLTGSLLLLLLGNITPAQAVPLEPAEANIFSMPGYTRGLLAYAKHRVRYSSIGRVVFGAPMGSPSFCPLSPKPGTIIELGGGPWTGTHQNSTPSDNSGRWQSENGYDVYAEDGSAVHAVVDGTICTTFNFGLSRDCGVGKRGLYGTRLHLCGDDGNVYYYMHLDHRTENIYVTQKTGRVSAGHVLGLVGTFQECSGIRDHLHWSIKASPWESWKCSGPSDSRCPSEVVQFAEYNVACQESGWSGAIPPPVGGGPPVQPPPPSEDPVVTAWPPLPVLYPIGGDDGVPAMEFCFDPSDGSHPSGRDVVECIPDDPQCRDSFCSGTCAQSGDSCSYTWDDRGQFCTYVEHCEQHGVCEGSRCVLKEGRLGQTKREERTPPGFPEIGIGELLCEFDSDCAAVHTTCRGSQCVEVPGSGENECQLGTNTGCPKISHYSCVAFSGVGGTIGTQCALVPGSGPDECKPGNEAEDCNLPDIPRSTLFCGDGVCQAWETPEFCPVDCSSAPLPPPSGTATCLDRETVFVCGLPEVDAGLCTSFELGDTIIRPGPDGIFDQCGVPNEMDEEAGILCNDLSDCFRSEHSSCDYATRTCAIEQGPGINMCGNPPLLDDSICTCRNSGTCQAIRPDSFCPVQNMLPFWGQDRACEAALVCDGESKGNVWARNTSCLRRAHGEYSIGLFQINLTAGSGRCPQGIRKNPNGSCTIVNQSEFEACLDKFGWGNGAVNSERAVKIFDLSTKATCRQGKPGSGWCPWSAAFGSCRLIDYGPTCTC